ncbi:MAG: T9SS type A sorting domain-containing protein [Flavobacteriales bacterium]|nr:T9SS type A sorting domain-containing protein [Flavobacteriales bacterium]
MRRFSLTLAALLVLVGSVFSQCPAGEYFIQIEINPDSYPNETSWQMVDGSGNVLGQGTTNGAEICVPEDECIVFNIFDSYGDGICCGFGEGSYAVYQDGVLIATGGDFQYSETVIVSCPDGGACDVAIDITEGSYTTLFDDTWYTFTPAETGMYGVSTCTDANACDTRVWIYDYCNMSNFDESNEAAIYFDDNEGGCGELAQVNALLEGGVTYWIRIGDTNDDCDAEFNWALEYNGPPAGCTDPEMCNYSPLAVLDDGSCVPYGDPNCTGPDLVVVHDAIVNSMYVDYMEVAETDCYIGEGCLNGFGTRELIRFTTHIKNIGDVDYYIGPAGDGTPGQFEWADCHQHWHYAGYAEYALLDSDNNWLPIGFKNGFCVIDLECSDGGTAQYGCSNMGISAHCGDIYGAGLSCQWIDVTDVPDGDYTLIVRVNWDESPDALGHYEQSYTNNWAQVCLNIDRSGGELEYTILDDCEVYVDCEGVEFGTAVQDCNGECGGTALAGDLDNNGAQEFADATSYVDHILANDIDATMCNDLNQDDDINVTDAALLALCQYYNVAHQHPDSSGVHNKCNLPVAELINPFDSVWFRIADINLDQNYLDIEVRNPYNRIVGYQFEMSGLEITSIASIADPISYPITPDFSLGGSTVIGLSYEDSSLVKSLEFQPLVRLYYMNPANEICISSIVDVVNDYYQNTMNYIIDGCVSTVGVTELTNEGNVSVYPNPFSEQTEIQFSNPTRSVYQLVISDLSGRVVRQEGGITGGRVTVERGELAQGTYQFVLTGDLTYKGRLIVK